MNILIIDPNYAFLSNCESAAFLFDDEDINIIKAQKLTGIDGIIKREQPDRIAINAMYLDSLLGLDIDVPYAVYARTKADEYTLSNSATPSYGYISSADELLEAVTQDRVQTGKHPEKQPKHHDSPKHHDAPKQQKNQNRPEPQPSKKQTVYYGEDVEDDEEDDDLSNLGEGVIIEDDTDNPDYDKDDALDFEDEPDDIKEPPAPHKAVHHETDERLINTARREGRKPQNNPNTPYNQAAKPTKSANDFQTRAREAKKQLAEEKRKAAMATSAAALSLDEEVDKDMGIIKAPTKVVTVYSSKGGVGKTTIACELATFFALTASGRGRLKVCLVDCNIDFGDVLNTLDFDVNGPCMMDWYSDLEVKLENGTDPDSITYTEDEIMGFLQKKDTDGLYALLAPMTNEDSMELEGLHMEIMLRNLIRNGGFDFIIIDTGNNTRDSSFIALQMAEIVLMVLTQSTNTANCNASFLNAVEAMNRFGDEALDLNKIKLVINQIRPASSVGISVQELEDAFENPITGKPYETYARIKDSNDVRKAANNAEPLVYKASAEFTRSIAALASTLIGENHVLDAPQKKKGFFARFRKG